MSAPEAHHTHSHPRGHVEASGTDWITVTGSAGNDPVSNIGQGGMHPDVTDAVRAQRPKVECCPTAGTCMQEFVHGCQSFQIQRLTSLLANKGDCT